MKKDTVPLTAHSALTTLHLGLAKEDVRQAQQKDAMIQKLRNALEMSATHLPTTQREMDWPNV